MSADLDLPPQRHPGMLVSAFWQAAHEYGARHLSRQTDDGAEEAFWQDYAPNYDRSSPLAECATDLVNDLRTMICANWDMVEIGPGSGAFTRRLAPELSEITVIEPSAAMRAEFQRLWHRPSAVKTIGCKWEEAPVLKADFVFGANAFYRIKDITTALMKMNDVARHRVALVQTIGRPHANPLAVDIDGMVHERERADCLCDVLEEMGISHNRRDYHIDRPDGPGMVALIDWVPKASL
ncbi:class I SAM-dependent methyltransferase [Ahrensia marina]|uniref:class I SAM-dependent methyltransferase n=1 Tax=Ahrensia marina TaxID=1514904 RepID=UPI0035CFA222